MNDSSKIKMLYGLVAILVIINMSVIGFMLMHRPPHGDGRGPGGLIIREFKFDEAQQKKFKLLKRDHHAAMMRIGDQEHDLHNALFRSLSDTNAVSIALADSLIREIAAGEIEKETITYRHLSEVRQMCTPMQQKTFDDMIAKAMAHKPDGPPPHEH